MTDLELKLPPQVRSWFHVYFTIRRILFEMSGIQGRVALPDDPVFDMIKNVFDIGGFPSCKRICNEFRVDSTSDFRFHKGENSGLGNVYIWVSRVGAYKTSQNNILPGFSKFSNEGGSASKGSLLQYIENTESI